MQNVLGHNDKRDDDDNDDDDDYDDDDDDDDNDDDNDDDGDDVTHLVEAKFFFLFPSIQFTFNISIWNSRSFFCLSFVFSAIFFLYLVHFISQLESLSSTHYGTEQQWMIHFPTSLGVNERANK